jgi:5'-nucleotidase/UDP-sugar diphosphatase
MFKWGVVANLTRSMGYDATCLGNHEFDDGVPDLVEFIDATADAYPTLACNLDLRREPELQKRVSGMQVKLQTQMSLF